MQQQQTVQQSNTRLSHNDPAIIVEGPVIATISSPIAKHGQLQNVQSTNSRRSSAQSQNVSRLTSGCSSVTANIGSNVTSMTSSVAATRPVRGRAGEQTTVPAVSTNQRPSPPPSTVDLASTGTSDSDDIDTSLASSRSGYVGSGKKISGVSKNATGVPADTTTSSSSSRRHLKPSTTQHTLLSAKQEPVDTLMDYDMSTACRGLIVAPTSSSNESDESNSSRPCAPTPPALVLPLDVSSIPATTAALFTQ
jgi:hypothetical protein